MLLLKTVLSSLNTNTKKTIAINPLASGVVYRRVRTIVPPLILSLFVLKKMFFRKYKA